MGLGCGRLFAAVLLLSAPGAAQAPQDPLSNLDRAMELASKGQFSQAEGILLKLEKAYPQEAEIQHRLGLILLRQNKLKAASGHLESAVRLNPKSPLIWLAVAQARLRSNDRRNAVQAAQQAGALAPDEPAVWRALAMFYGQAQEFSKAADYEIRWSKAMPGDKASPLRATEYSVLAGEADQAIGLANAILPREESAPLENLLGKAYRLKRNPASAVEHLQRAVHLAPDEPRYYLDLAQLFLDHNTPDPAQMVMERAAQRFPGNVDVLRSLGLSYYAAGQKEKALDVFLKIVELDPDSDVTYASLEALLPDAGGRLGIIIEKLREYAAKHPSSPLGHYLLALSLSLQSGETVEAEQLLRKAIAVAPSFWPACFELHKYLKSEGKLKEAAELLTKTLQLNPESAAAHYSLAEIYAQLGDNQRAIEERKIHHELMVKQREETEQRRREAPKLNYQLVRK